MVKERTLVIGFLTLVILLSFIFLIVKINKHGNPISWEYDDDGSGSGSSSSSSEETDEVGSTKVPKCVDSSPETTSEEGLTTPDPDTAEAGGPDDGD